MTTAARVRVQATSAAAAALVLVFVGGALLIGGLAFAGVWPVAYVVLGSRAAGGLVWMVWQGAAAGGLGCACIYAAHRHQREG